ncbi:MAG: hypothetical protein B7C55_03060 [Actinomycetales bacterium mxb001]|nr:MAG: hypothetical protein B7C55_03060 [Actinomycetales bacterium mxb001]
MTTTLTRESLEGLAHRVYVAGIEATTPETLEVLAETAEAVGVSPVLVEVLVDPSEPVVARERAFALVACAVSGAVREQHTLAA